MLSRADLAGLWDEAVAGFLRGGSVATAEMGAWFRSCRGSGRTAVSTECFPEPFIGDIRGAFRAVVLGLNPGRPFPALQARDGDYAQAVRLAGGYSAWAARWPYLGSAWTSVMGKPNRFHKARFEWVRHWIGEPLPPARSHIVVELYPWHSVSLPQPFGPDIEAIRRFVWEPLSDLGPLPVFAFGARALFDVLPRLPGVEVLARLPSEGEAASTYGFGAPTREVMIGRAPTGGLLYIANHDGSDGPPPIHEVAVHKRLAQQFGGGRS